MSSRRFPRLFGRVERIVLSDRKRAAEREEARTAEALRADPSARVNRHHANFLATWWRLSYPREEMLRALAALPRYIVCGQVTKRPIFEFISPAIRPNAALMVFPFADDFSFGILQSDAHWQWFTNRRSTLTERFRYTSNTVFDTFAWPQDPTQTQVAAVAEAAVSLRKLRRALMKQHKLSLRELYRSLESPGKHPLKDAHAALDGAVRAAYGMSKTKDPLAFLLDLNARLAEKESKGETVVGPGWPASAGRKRLVTADCVE